MTEEEQDNLRASIKEEISGIEKSLKGLEEGSRPVEPDNAIGRLSRMEALSAKAVSENSLVNMRNRLSKLKLALNKVGNEEFGMCTGCGKQIPIKRLVLVPESSFCVNCVVR